MSFELSLEQKIRFQNLKIMEDSTPKEGTLGLNMGIEQDCQH